MNTDQIYNSIQKIIVLAAGGLIVKGYGDSSLWETVGGAVAGIATWYISHRWNATAPSTPTSVISPPPSSPSARSGFTRPIVLLYLSAICVALSLIAIVGCAALQPGQDPIVVNVERIQTIAAPTFDLVLETDNSQRAFWEQKAPAFHDFCESLRVRQIAFLADGTPTNVSRAIALQLNLDKVKLDYKASRAGSNDVFTALATLNSAMEQANAWLLIVTNAPAPAAPPVPLELIPEPVNSTDH